TAESHPLERAGSHAELGVSRTHVPPRTNAVPGAVSDGVPQFVRGDRSSPPGRVRVRLARRNRRPVEDARERVWARGVEGGSLRGDAEFFSAAAGIRTT